jgi:hypothetical protein
LAGLLDQVLDLRAGKVVRAQAQVVALADIQQPVAPAAQLSALPVQVVVVVVEDDALRLV